MTVNVIWSDSQCSYIVVDSARTHNRPPAGNYSALGQLQRIKERSVSVEEGAQKIVRIGQHCGAALCGNEHDLLEMVGKLRALFEQKDATALVDYMQKDNSDVRFDLSISCSGFDDPFLTFCLPDRRISVLRRNEATVYGSLPEHLEKMLGAAVENNVIDDHLTSDPRLKLVGALTYATAMAIHHDFTTHGVGGAFFGALIDDSGFRWQPDITYLLYAPGSYKKCQEVKAEDLGSYISDVPNTNDIFDVIQTWVRDDAVVSSSSITDKGVVAISRGSVPDVEAWKEKWVQYFKTCGLGATDYYVFIPKSKGVVLIVPNKDTYFQMRGTDFCISTEVTALLERPPSNGDLSFVVLP